MSALHDINCDSSHNCDVSPLGIVIFHNRPPLIYIYIYIYICMYVCMYVCMYAVLEITAGHWPFSNQFQHLADQNLF